MDWSDPQWWGTALSATSLAASGSAITLAAMQRLRAKRHQMDEAAAVLEGQDRLIGKLAELSEALAQFRATPTAAGQDLSGNGGAIPEVLISARLLEALVDRMRTELDDRPQVEVGFALVGRIDGDGEGRRIVLNGMIEAGTDDRSCGHVRFDREHQQQELDLLRSLDHRVMHLGDAHTHPGDLNEPSGGDLATDAGNVRASNTQEMVFVIATDQRHVRQRRLDGLRRATEPPGQEDALRGLRLNFFYLGKASEYRYRRVAPRVAGDEPMLSFPLSLRTWHAFDPTRFVLELDVLRRIAGWSMRIVPGSDAVSLQFVSPTRRTCVLVRVEDYPQQPPAIFVRMPSGQTVEYDEAALHLPGWSPRTWLISLLLPLLQDLGDGGVHTGGATLVDETPAVTTRLIDRRLKP